jgi:hypothetical protein
MVNMKILILLLCSALAASAQFATFRDVAYVGNAASPSVTAPNLLTQDFTTGSIPGGWTTDTATPNYGFQWPALDSTYSLGLTNVNARSHATFTATSEFFVYFKMLFTETNYNGTSIMWLENAGTVALTLNWEQFGHQLLVYDTTDAHEPSPSTTIATNTIYNVWIHYKAGSGANAVLSLGVSTSLSEPVSGSGYAETTVGTSTVNPSAIYFSQPGTNGVVFDHIGISTSRMGTGW